MSKIVSVLVFLFSSQTLLAEAFPWMERAQTESGHEMSMNFGQHPTESTQTAVFCSEQSSRLVRAKLWMVMSNGHAHGSTPTRILERADGCYEIQRINFLMPGEWQILITFANRDKGKFVFDVGTVSQTVTHNDGALSEITFMRDVVAGTHDVRLCTNLDQELTEVSVLDPERNRIEVDVTIASGDRLGCYEIEGIEFDRSGNWTLECTFADDDQVAFDVSVR